MIVEIESYQGDTLLYGRKISFAELKKQFETVESLYDKTEDNFVALFCRMYHWTVAENEEKADYLYDRDTKKCMKIHS